MIQFTGLELSPGKSAYVKYLSLQGGTVKISGIAGYFEVDPSTVTRTIHDLTKEGYVEHESYGAVILTDFGREYGAFLVRRHRILGLVLSHYGLSEDEACQEASRMECFLSRDAVNKMCRALGHPTLGFCGEICHDPLCLSMSVTDGLHENVS
jgi:DtxR family transcriptional regulator, Mn-dependent transcriptional regulator